MGDRPRSRQYSTIDLLSRQNGDVHHVIGTTVAPSSYTPKMVTCSREPFFTTWSTQGSRSISSSMVLVSGMGSYPVAGGDYIPGAPFDEEALLAPTATQLAAGLQSRPQAQRMPPVIELVPVAARALRMVADMDQPPRHHASPSVWLMAASAVLNCAFVTVQLMGE